MVGASESCLVGGTAGYMQWHSRIYGGGLFDYSVKPGLDFVNFKARFGLLVTRLARSRTCLIFVLACLIIVSTPGPCFVMVKVRFGQVSDEVGQGSVWSSWLLGWPGQGPGLSRPGPGA